MHRVLLSISLLLTAVRCVGADDVWSSKPAVPGGPIAFAVVSRADDNGDPAAAGTAAAESLRKAMGQTPPKVVLVSECFEDRENKEKCLAGICSVLPKEIVVGAATYGSFTQGGATDADTVCLLGIGGDGIGVSAALVTGLGTSKLSMDTDQPAIQEKLHAAGAKLAGKLPRTQQDRLVVLLADAHSPKNQYLVEGVQQVIGKPAAITGGSANKNAGQTFVYFAGQPYQDSAVALALSGDFRVTMAGRQAKDNDRVIATAEEGAREASASVQGQPIAALAFDCAGRRSKLKNLGDEVAAMQKVLGRSLPLFGCYCAGEIGPVDQADKPSDARCGGSGWHVMFTLLSR
jgi:hypothetical protein